MGPSHFAEKARWALARAGLAYDERMLLPGLHVAQLKRFGTRTVPVLDTGSAVLRDSTDILRFAEPALFASQEACALEEQADETIGPLVRAWMYSWVTHDRELLMRAFGFRASFAQRLILQVLTRRLGPILRRRFARGRSEDELYELLKESLKPFEERLQDGRRYLVGDRFSAADLSLASLLAHAVGCDAFHGAALPLKDRPDKQRVRSEALRSMAVGRHVLRMYAEEWSRTSPDPASP